jgi:hypothetical protein
MLPSIEQTASDAWTYQNVWDLQPQEDQQSARREASAEPEYERYVPIAQIVVRLEPAETSPFMDF